MKTSEKNVHGGNIFYPFCDMSANFTPWGWGTQNLCEKTGTDSGAGSCVNFRKSLDNNYTSNSLKTVAFIFMGGIMNLTNYNLSGRCHRKVTEGFKEVLY